jgi:hypothetical protein
MVGTDYSHTDIPANLGALESDARDPALIILDESRLTYSMARRRAMPASCFFQ